MSERTRKHTERSSTNDATGSAAPVETHAAEKTSPQTNRLDHDIESILDEIDDVLEANAEDFVRNYVQKGGE